MSNVTCYHCKEKGHVKTNCPILKGIPVKRGNVHMISEETDTPATEKIQFSFSENTPRKYLATGTTNGQ